MQFNAYISLVVELDYVDLVALETDIWGFQVMELIIQMYDWPNDNTLSKLEIICIDVPWQKVMNLIIPLDEFLVKVHNVST